MDMEILKFVGEHGHLNNSRLMKLIDKQYGATRRATYRLYCAGKLNRLPVGDKWRDYEYCLPDQGLDQEAWNEQYSVRFPDDGMAVGKGVRHGEGTTGGATGHSSST